MPSLPPSHQSVALGQATCPFAIPTAYSHEPRRAPVNVKAQVPASMDPGLDEALRRDSHRIADVRSRFSSRTAALQGWESGNPSRRQSSHQIENCSRPSARQRPSDSNLAKDRAALDSSQSVGLRSRYSASSTDSKLRPTSATSCASVQASARSSAPTSVRTSPRPHNARSGGDTPQEDMPLQLSEATRPQGDNKRRLATATSARSTLSSSAGRPSTNCSGPSRVQHHASDRAPCPVHGALPLASQQPGRDLPALVSAGITSVESTAGHLAGAPCLPFDQPAATELSRPKAMPPVGHSIEIANKKLPAKPAATEAAQTGQKLRAEPAVPKAQVASTPKAIVTIANVAEHDYAVLQAMHAAEVAHLHPGTSYYTPKNGCEAIFLPRPSLSHSHSESDGAIGCMAFPRDRHETITPAHGSEKGSRRDQTSMEPRTTFERHRRLTYSGSLPKSTLVDVLKSDPLPCRAHQPSLRSSASMLDLSRVAHAVPGQTLQQLLPKPPPSRKGEVRGATAGTSLSPAASIARTKSEGNLRRYVEDPNQRKSDVPVRNKARITSTVQHADDWSSPSDPTDVIRSGHELEAERLKWRREFARSVEGRESAGCVPFVRTRSRSKPRSREAVLEAGPLHSHFSIRRSRKETLQHDSVMPLRSSEARGLAGGASKGHSHRPADVQRTTSTSRIKAVSLSARNKTEATARRLPDHDSRYLVVDKAAGSTSNLQRPPGATTSTVPVPDSFKYDDAGSSSHSSLALRHAPAPPQRPSILRQLSIPRKAPPERPLSAASDAFDLTAAGKYSKRVSSRFSTRGSGEESITSASGSLEDSASGELVVIGRSSQCADIEVLDSAAAMADEWHTQSLGSHDGSESVLALEAETMLLQQSTLVTERLTVDEVRRGGSSLATARMGSSSSRRTMVPSPPPRPLPDQPLPSIPRRLC